MEGYQRYKELLKGAIDYHHTKYQNDSAKKNFAEELKHIGDQWFKVMLDLCNQVWKTGGQIADWKGLLLILIHRKRSTCDIGARTIVR
ncbi:unnamed protein product [Pieris macdunnoughi]|uniref:Uncharacterized protein n=1 Tax=Pieris macdunnoughi TaxID=345717 RepID=A0A821SE95_9NEOP|nr:unnamed protein product [Pieris macdunnoughi]